MTKTGKPHPQQTSPNRGSVIRAHQTTVYSGQLPPPEMLERFETIHPGFTNRLLTMVEDESKFKRDQDRIMVGSFKTSTILGIVFAFLSVIIISIVALYAIYKGFGASAAGIMGTCVVGVIIAFIQRRKRTKEENGH